MHTAKAFKPIVKPLFRWVGGKQKLARWLAPRIRPFLQGRVYVEPFLGAGSFFFHLRPSIAILSDKNRMLIDCYKWIRRCPKKVWRAFSRHIEMDSKDHYYTTRRLFNSCPSSAEQAARFIYLNRTCFNGVYRVNTKGDFNVPYGHKDRPKFPTEMDLAGAARALRSASVACSSFISILSRIGAQHFVYLDPPYPPLDRTAYFRHYTAERFEDDDQSCLCRLVKQMDQRGALVLLTMPDTEATRRHYRGFAAQRIRAVRYVSCRETKRRVRDLVISNFEF